MPPHAPGVHTHEEWKGMAQPVGLVVEPVVLNRLGIFPESATTVLADWQQRLEQLLEDQPVGEQWLSVAPSFELFCQEVLAWQDGDLRKPEELPAPVAVHLDDYDEVLRPDWFVHEPSQGDGALKAQLLVQELPLGAPFDALPKGLDGRRQWEATPQQRLERLLKESEHPIGLLWNGVALRMVYAPRGESSGHLTFPLEPMTTVDGRPMLAALQMLLGPDRLFEGGASNTRLRPLMEQSRKEQNEVSTRLAEQVLEALWILLRGFDAAGLEANDPSHIYGGLITVLLRLVFLLYAEDEELMPSDSLYGQHYSVGGLALRLRQDRADYQNAMEGRRGAWATLLSLFRLVYDGGGSTEAYLPARHGDLFDPDAYPFLEGRTTDTSYTDGPLASVPAISDDVVEQVLTKLLLLDGQILSYRALDVEQIGSVYEGIMGFMVEKATGPSVGITHKPPRQKITITVVVNAEELLAQPPGKRDAWLKDVSGVDLKLPSKASKGLKAGTSVEDLCDALDKRLSKHTPRGGFQAGSLILQPTAERRRSGSHYTPRALTEPIVAEAFRPWLECCKGKPTAEQILALKVCDPAMGSGAFLVAVCRYLAVLLVQAWEREGYPEGFRQEWDKDTVARRLIAQRCLYGVDKNPFAVNLAKLSLWLVTLSKELPFTFVDHAFKCGDSLVGYSVSEIRVAMHHVQLGFLDDQNRIYEQMGIDRRESFAFDSLTDADYDSKKQKLEQQIKATEGLRQAGDLMVAAFFAKSKPKERADKQQVYLAMLSGAFHDEGLAETVQEVRKQLSDGDKGITPFHWDLEFPEVFRDEQYGFDVFVGNPPFLGGSRISETCGMEYFQYLGGKYRPSLKHCDLCGFFLRACFDHCLHGGTISLITTNTICQGDSRESSLEQITRQGGLIYSARKRVPWPGVAAVIVSVIHILKANWYKGNLLLDANLVSRISSFLIESNINKKPMPLAGAWGYSLGSKIYGQGFLFSDHDESCTPVSVMHALLKSRPEYGERILPYIGGEDINQRPDQDTDRFCISTSDIKTEEDLKAYPEIYEILKSKVYPERMKLGNNPNNIPLKRRWWAFQAHRPELYAEINRRRLSRVIACSQVSTHLQFTFLPNNYIYSQKLVIVPDDDWLTFGVLQSRIHEAWARLFSSTMKDDLNYSPSDCLSNFPKPSDLSYLEEARSVAQAFYRQRGRVAAKGCLTDASNALCNPLCGDTETLDLRDMFAKLDAIVAKSYSLSPDRFSYGFTLAYLPALDESEAPQGLQEFLSGGIPFFVSIEAAREFDSLWQASFSKPRKLPWRYGWPDPVRDTVLARLLALNAEIYEEEVNLGLHTKGAKQAAKGTSKRNTKSASSDEFHLTSEPYQTGLKLF
jgi:hypothetical protein